MALLLVVACATLAALAGQGSDSAKAHPLGNFTVNRYARLEVYQHEVRLVYVIDFAEIPTFQEMGEIDANNDGPSADELAAWAGRLAPQLLPGLTLRFGEQPAPMTLLSQAAETGPGQANLPVLRFVAEFAAPVPGELRDRQPVTIAFSDLNYDDRLGWREIVVAPSQGAVVSTDRPYVDRSSALRAYPSQSLADAPDESSVQLTWEAGTGAARPVGGATDVGAPAGRQVDGFSALVARTPTLPTVLLAMLAALGFGMLHALGPGHGKTVVAAYLVGSHGTAQHALALGLTVTATHTSMVYLLGFVSLALSAYILPDQLFAYLGVASGLLVAAFGAALLIQRLRSAFVRAAGPGEHRHGLWGRPHSHAPATRGQNMGEGATHDHEPGAGHGAPAVGWRGILGLGVLGGMLPCPSAIVVMLAAISLGQVVFGMLLIVAFSAGLAGVLVGIGLAIVLGRRISRGVPGKFVLERRAAKLALVALPMLSAFAITLVGVALTLKAWGDFQI